MNIAVITIGDKNIKEYSKYTFPINQHYCSLYDYTYIQYNQSLDTTRPTAWSKILAIKNHIDHFDWIFYIDADVIFYNHDLTIEEHIDEKYNLILSEAMSDTWINEHHKHTENFVNINTGSFLIKGKNSWSKFLLDLIYSQTNRINHYWWENQALSDIYLQNNVDINKKIKILKQNILNGFEHNLYGYNYYFDQYILHWAGMSIQDKTYFASMRFKEFTESKFNGKNKKLRFFHNG